ARLDAIGVFGYSDEDGTEAAGFDGKLDQDEIDERAARLSELAEELTAQRAAERIGERIEVLVERVEAGGHDGGDETGELDGEQAEIEGRAAQQGPETDGSVRLIGQAAAGLRVGALISALVVDSDGVDLVAELA